MIEFMYKYKDDFCLIDLAVIDRKYEYEFEHNMYKYYIQDSYNSPYRIVHQVKELNQKVINRILPEMITNIKQNEEYITRIKQAV